MNETYGLDSALRRSVNSAYDNSPRDYALELIENGITSRDNMILSLLKYMSHDDVRGALDANELSPRFLEEED